MRRHIGHPGVPTRAGNLTDWEERRRKAAKRQKHGKQIVTVEAMPITVPVENRASRIGDATSNRCSYRHTVLKPVIIAMEITIALALALAAGLTVVSVEPTAKAVAATVLQVAMSSWYPVELF